MAPVLARLVRLLAGLCLAAAVSIVVQAGVWAVIAMSDVRDHGLSALTHPERVAEDTVERPAATSVAPPIRPVTGTSGPSAPSAKNGTTPEPERAESAERPTRARRTSDRLLSAFNGIATVAGVGSILLLPLVLVVAFVTTLVRAPSAAGATLGGVLWSVGLVGLLMPWSSWWPQLGWGGLFLPYADLLAEAEALAGVAGPLGIEPLIVHIGVPAVAIGILVGIAWRCGEALHAELLAAESLVVDAAVERDAAASAARGATIALGRSATSLAAATGSPIPMVAGTSDEAIDEPAQAAPRRMI